MKTLDINKKFVLVYLIHDTSHIIVLNTSIAACRFKYSKLTLKSFKARNRISVCSFLHYHRPTNWQTDRQTNQKHGGALNIISALSSPRFVAHWTFFLFCFIPRRAIKVWAERCPLPGQFNWSGHRIPSPANQPECLPAQEGRYVLNVGRYCHKINQMFIYCVFLKF